MEYSAEDLKALAGDLTVLIRDELELARQEMVEKVKSAGIGAGMLSGSALAGLFAVAAASITLGLLLALVLPSWLAAVIVTVIWMTIAAFLALAGRRKIGEAAPFIPEQTIADLKEDARRARRRR